MIDLVEHVRQTISKRRLFQRGESVLVAVSGGLDSMVLLDVLQQLAPENRWKLFVAHFNHQLRGRSSAADERFVRKVARKFGLMVLVSRTDVRRMAVQHQLSIEMAARTARHIFFAGVAKTWGIPNIAVAHHADDQVELFLLRLLRGAGAQGLAGMRWLARSPVSSGVMVARPLLDATRKHLAEYARDRKIRHREDATNADTDFLRNRVRHKLIPLLTRDFQPAFKKVLLRQMEILATESEFLNQLAEHWLKNPRSKPFDKLAVALQRRCLQHQLINLRIAVDFDLVEKLRESSDRAIVTDGAIPILRDSAGLVQIAKKSLGKFRGRALPIDLSIHKSNEITFGGATFRWAVENVRTGTFRAHSKPANSEAFDAHKTGNCIVLRHWQPGDRFQPLGMKKAVKLQDLFTNAKIPRVRRREMVVVTTKTGDIVWVEGLRPGERYKLDKRTRRRLNWYWRRG